MFFNNNRKMISIDMWFITPFKYILSKENKVLGYNGTDIILPCLDDYEVFIKM